MDFEAFQKLANDVQRCMDSARPREANQLITKAEAHQAITPSDINNLINLRWDLIGDVRCFNKSVHLIQKHPMYLNGYVTLFHIQKNQDIPEGIVWKQIKESISLITEKFEIERITKILILAINSGLPKITFEIASLLSVKKNATTEFSLISRYLSNEKKVDICFNEYLQNPNDLHLFSLVLKKFPKFVDFEELKISNDFSENNLNKITPIFVCVLKIGIENEDFSYIKNFIDFSSLDNEEIGSIINFLVTQKEFENSRTIGDLIIVLFREGRTFNRILKNSICKYLIKSGRVGDSGLFLDFDNKCLSEISTGEAVLAASIASGKGRIQKAKDILIKKIELGATDKIILSALGALYLSCEEYENASNCFEKIGSIEEISTLDLGRYFICERTLGRITSGDSLAQHIKERCKSGDFVEPFPLLLALDSPRWQFKASRALCLRIGLPDKNQKMDVNKTTSKFLNDRLRIGFFSSDFYRHATSYLLFDFLEELSTRSFEIHLFYYGINPWDEHSKRLASLNLVFHDLTSLGVVEVEAYVREHVALDVAFDLKGHTAGNMLSLFGRRIAPLQVAFLGFPGSTGFSEIDYFIGDEIASPISLDPFFSERIIRLRCCYQPPTKTNGICRSHRGGGSFVFGSFNSTVKISGEDISLWARILHRCQEAEFRIYAKHETAFENIKHAFGELGISANRLSHMKPVDHETHLKRISEVDVCLDTLVCSGHTTVTDCLAACTPVISHLGTSFASRVAASILVERGLSELVCNSAEDYADLAVRIFEERVSTVPRLRGKVVSVTEDSVKTYCDEFERIIDEKVRRKN